MARGGKLTRIWSCRDKPLTISCPFGRAAVLSSPPGRCASPGPTAQLADPGEWNLLVDPPHNALALLVNRKGRFIAVKRNKTPWQSSLSARDQNSERSFHDALGRLDLEPIGLPFEHP